MKPFRVFSRVVLIGASLYAIATEVVRRKPASPPAPNPWIDKKRLVWKTALGTVIAGMLLLAFGGFLLMASGFYDISADEPHFGVVRWFLRTGRTRSVEFHSRNVNVPAAADPTIVTTGLRLYIRNCQPCHGGPGVSRDQLGRGINPTPPPLPTAVHNWSDAQLYWIISHGLKMSGMPSFAVRLSEAERWAVVLFLRRLPLLSPADYVRLGTVASDDGNIPPSTWIAAGDWGFSDLRTHGVAASGRQLVDKYGCGTCHRIPGVPAADGRVGPPLDRFAERQYIAGSLVNVPANSAAWIVNPQQFEPHTAMPNLNVQPGEALDITAYLYTLGSSQRLDGIRRVLLPATQPH